LNPDLSNRNVPRFLKKKEKIILAIPKNLKVILKNNARGKSKRTSRISKN